MEVVTQEESRKVLIGVDPEETRPIQRLWWKRHFCWVHQTNEDGVEESPQQGARITTLATTNDVDTKVNPMDLVRSRKWPTPWYWQLVVLIVRTFRQSRHVILSKLNLIETVLLSVICSLIWFQIPDDEASINDRNGYVSS